MKSTAVGLLLTASIAFSGCKRSSLEASKQKILPGLSQPVRISSGDTDAAEPAIAAAPDGSVYVV